MPLYEYECTKCGHRFEVIRKFSDPHEKKCPVCKGGVRKLLSAPAIQFKGTGWYITDYSRKGGREPSSSSREGKGKAADSSGKAADTGVKPAETSGKTGDTGTKPADTAGSGAKEKKEPKK